ncbi:gamma-glutamylcyclotransferase [Oceanicaulis sp. MMSF_3324]|uniref:gamma-glutamylcyclotransferase family protein n=1 Tax=Oceanicaulis sp. MMSF_3324 TaxID=3046702 RepID=UPI00273DA15A|nr:gamma-glutamylcyclotransferase family protein [Oceanicaulis sp. MMSF_3324]
MTEVRAGEAFAVYGLLRAGESGFAQFGLEHAFAPLGPCVLPGQLYDLGAYPGLVDAPGEVIGELFEVRDASVMPRVDAFEDYWPEDRARSRYERRKVRLIEPDRDAWVYIWILGVEDARLIESGDWFRR